ncbi:MAG: fibronectin type III domain-containing protein [Dehalobacterium sp.]
MKQTRKIGKLIVMAALIMSLLSVFTLADIGLGINGPCHVVLSPTSSAEEMAVTWWDQSDVTEASVQYSTTIGFSDIPGANVSIAEAAITRSDTGKGYTSFEATLTGLSANTTYYYRVGQGEVWSDEYRFTTANPGQEEVSFMYLGDIQYATAATAPEDYQAWGSLVQGAYQSFPELNFALLGGDMVQNGMNEDDWQMFLAQAATVFSKLPMLAVPGNHESNSASTGKPELFLDFLAMPANGPSGFEEEFYSCDYGDCHIVGLSSGIFMNEQLLKGSMTEEDFDTIAGWIEEDLANSDAKWKIVMMHHPAYAVVSDATAAEVLENWAPIFVEAQVDLVFCGHQHIYMRTKPIQGVTYVMGNSGSKHYAPADVPYSEVMIADTSTYQIVTAEEDSLTMNTYDTAGDILDTVTLLPKDRTIPWEDPILGDVDGDGDITETDVGIIINAILNFLPYDSLMDINNDGQVDICDAHKLALYLEE